VGVCAPRETFVDGRGRQSSLQNSPQVALDGPALSATVCRTGGLSQLRQVGRRRARRLPESAETAMERSRAINPGERQAIMVTRGRPDA
jgi:hypothetical protein